MWVGGMVNIGEAGRICLNQERLGACENCLWWEWDTLRGECINSQYHVCPLFRERLFSQGVQGQPRFKEARPGVPPSSGAGLADPPDAKAGESGTS